MSDSQWLIWIGIIAVIGNFVIWAVGPHGLWFDFHGTHYTFTQGQFYVFTNSLLGVVALISIRKMLKK